MHASTYYTYRFSLNQPNERKHAHTYVRRYHSLNVNTPLSAGWIHQDGILHLVPTLDALLRMRHAAVLKQRGIWMCRSYMCVIPRLQ